MISTASTVPTPISVSTSEAWDNDGGGLWSTFIVEVGTPPQPGRVIISTATDETWVVLESGCPTSYGSNCDFSRGGIFDPASSTSWTNNSLFELDLEQNLGYTGNGQYGYDEVQLGYPGSGGPKLANQVVAGTAAPDFWLGTFGLDPAPSNFTTLNDPQPSFLWSLVNQSMIPSTSWGYTAGAYYKYNTVQGSLTLGGYDTSRFESTNLTFPFYDDNSRRFIVELNTIKYIPTGVSTITTATTLMSEPISMLIDSTIPFIYLPISICSKFESEFGLQWDATDEIYTINSTQHTALQNLSPNITFTIANTAGQNLDIVFPYSAFDLTATFPVLSNISNIRDSVAYFPLKRADNDTQYTLGRAFLQETYLIADYDRAEFTVSPCVWPPTFDSKIVAIHPPSSVVQNTPIHKMPLAAIAGIAVSALLLVLTTLSLLYFLRRRRLKAKKVKTPPSTVEKGNSYTTLGALHDKPELDANATFVEMLALEEEKTPAEVGGKPLHGQEMDSEETVIIELPGPEMYELSAEEFKEMPAREAIGNELPSPEDTKETPWVLASEILSRVARPSPMDILSPVENMGPGTIGDGLVSPLSPAARPGRRFFFPGTDDGKRHDAFYNP